MPTPVKKRFFKTPDSSQPGGFIVQALDVPESQREVSGLSEISPQAAQGFLDAFKGNYQGIEQVRKALAQPIGEYVVAEDSIGSIPAGAFTSQSSIQKELERLGRVSSGIERPISSGLSLPSGSAGDILNQEMARRAGGQTFGVLAGGGATPTPQVATTQPITSGIQVGEDSGKDELIKQLTQALEKQEGQGTLTERFESLQQEAGIPRLRERVGTFDEEINKARDLLADLDARIRQGQSREEARRAPMELIVGRQAEIARQNQLERVTTSDLIDTLSRSRTTALNQLSLEQQDVLTKLGLAEKDLNRPLEQLQTEISIRSDIKNLTEQDIPNVVSSQFNDEGDLTIVMQDPETGAFSTQTMKGIGEKSGNYQSVTSQRNDQGDVTFFGVKEDGTVENLGTFKGVGSTGGGAGAVTTLDDLAKLGYVRRGAEDGGWNFFKNGEPISADQIVQETGVSLATLLAGSQNPADIAKISDSTPENPFR